MHEEIKEEPADSHQCGWCDTHFTDKKLFQKHARKYHTEEYAQMQAAERELSAARRKAGKLRWNQDNQATVRQARQDYKGSTKGQQTHFDYETKGRRQEKRE